MSTVCVSVVACGLRCQFRHELGTWMRPLALDATARQTVEGIAPPVTTLIEPVSGSPDLLATRDEWVKGRALSRAPCDDDSSHDLLPFLQDVTTSLVPRFTLLVSVFSVYRGRVCERTRCVGASCWPLVHRCSPSSLLLAERGWFMHLPLLLLPLYHRPRIHPSLGLGLEYTSEHCLHCTLHPVSSDFGQDLQKPTAQHITAKTMTQLSYPSTLFNSSLS